MALSDIVSVNITAATKTPSQAGFGTPMFAVRHSVTANTVETYSSLNEMVTAGWAATDTGYLMAQAAFSQSPSPSKIKIGRRTSTAVAQDVLYTFTPKGEGFVHSATIGAPGATAETATHTEGASSTAAAIGAAMTTAINALTGAFTATDNLDGTVNVVADTAGPLFNHIVTAGTEVTDVTADAGIATDLAAIYAADSDFYGVAIDTGSKAEIIAMAAWVEANPVIAIAHSFDGDILDSGSTTDVASTLQTSAYARTGVIYSADLFKYAGCAWLGKQLPTQPGTTTWAYKTLAGVPADALTTGQSQAAQAKNANTYETVAGLNITFEGKTASGEFIDVTRTSDWIVARIKESVYGALVNAPKIPFTNRGGAIIGSRIKAPLLVGEGRGVFAEGTSVVTVPAKETLPTADVASRKWTGIQWSTTLTGAVHKVPGIGGTLSV